MGENRGDAYFRSDIFRKAPFSARILVREQRNSCEDAELFFNHQRGFAKQRC